LSLEKYHTAISGVLDRIWSTQSDAIRKASVMMADAAAKGGLVHLFGSGHSVLPVQDIFPRYGSYPVFRPHVVQGWGPDFIPKLAEDAVGQGFIDRVVAVNGAQSLELARRLAMEEGILAGISAGATLAGAFEVCRGLPRGANVLCMIPDTGERYLSTPLFEDVPAEMTDEEIELSRSTPGYRFDAQPPPPVPAPAPAVESTETPVVDPAAAVFVADAIGDARGPVVLFALEWCEVCWSLRRLFTRLGIPFRSIDLDSVDFQRDDLGGRIRTALAARTGMTTIPQLFVGGEFVGGCTDTLDAWRSGRLQAMLDATGTAFDRSAEVDPYAFLPRWLQPR